MTINEMREGYEKEVAYQKHMLRNLGYWFQLFTIISGVGLVLIYLFHDKTLWPTIIGWILFVIGALGMFTFGYTGWRGQKNVQAVVADYEMKVEHLHKQVQKAVK